MANPNNPFPQPSANSAGGGVIGRDAQSQRDFAGRDINYNYAPSLRQQTSPHQLPASERDFVGREDEINQFKEQLRRGEVVSINEMPGVGKTELARKIADDLREEFPDLQMEIDLRGTIERPKDVLEAIAEVIRAFG